MGNYDGAVGAFERLDGPVEFRHPRTHPVEARLVQELRKAEYMRRAKAEAIEWLRAHRGEFLKLTASRRIRFWLGPLHEPGKALAITALTLLALMGAWHTLPGMSLPQRAALMTPLICYPLVYYVVIYMPRYRWPLDWTLFLLAGTAVWRWIERPVKVSGSASGSA